MDSRINKYDTNSYNQEMYSKYSSTRSARNASLYKEVNDRYGDLDNLPIEDNTNEIDISRLRELVLHDKNKKEEREIRDNLNVLKQEKRKIDQQKVYDINKLLEKAKYENDKLKEPVMNTSKSRRNILSTLESTELSLEDIKLACSQYKKSSIQDEKESNNDKSLSMTRELKFKELNNEIEKENNNKDYDNSLSLDLFDDLKPTGNTIVTKPITEEVKEEKEIPKKEILQKENNDNDISDIDIIKKSSGIVNNDFFTNSYEFSKKDFMNDDDDLFDESNSNGIFKIVLLVLAIFVFVGVIVYFVGVYGLGLT